MDHSAPNVYEIESIVSFGMSEVAADGSTVHLPGIVAGCRKGSSRQIDPIPWTDRPTAAPNRLRAAAGWSGHDRCES